MATSGRDGSLRIWDLRNSFTPLSSVKVDVASSLDFSQRGLLAMGTSSQALVNQALLCGMIT
jgi:WD40 repeat protein